MGIDSRFGNAFTRIILTGFSGTGKSTIGRRIAELLGWDFVDTDDWISNEQGKSISSIFEKEGETRFRYYERDVLRRLIGSPHTVISTGGGIVLDDENRKSLLDSGLVVCLEATPETIHARLTEEDSDSGSERNERPMLNEEGIVASSFSKIKTLKAGRQWAYALAHWIIVTDGLSVEQSAQEVIRVWNRVGVAKNLRSDPEVAAVVTAGDQAYPVVVGWDILESQLGMRVIGLGQKGRAFVVSDEGVYHSYARYAQRSLHEAGIETHMFAFPAGEVSKTLRTCEEIYCWLLDRHVERGDVIVAVGGGVAGDIAGFVAATYLRGVRLVQIPTTLLAMLDASIGGKTGVDLPGGKNLIGAFYQPSLVLADVSALTTLPDRVKTEGWAEAIKHGFALDSRLVEIYERYHKDLLALDPEITTEVVGKNAALKALVVSQDEKEKSGARALLNYGHTIGHAIETAGNYSRYLHGEAVSIGMNAAAILGNLVGITPKEVVDRQKDLLGLYGLPLQFKNLSPGSIMDAMTRDKKVKDGEISWILLHEVGRSASHIGIPSDQVERAVAFVTEGFEYF